MDNATPMLRQYLEIKKQYPGTILFFRLGDFYEMFNEDALIGSRELEITLTARQKESANPIPMCGVPYHAAPGYISRLVNKGYRVAICEQTEAPAKGVKLVRREVVRVITPGTAIDSQLVDPKETIYLAAVSNDRDKYGIALLDLSTGGFEATQIAGQDSLAKVNELLGNYAPREIIFPMSAQQLASVFSGNSLAQGTLPSDHSATSAPLLQGSSTPVDDLFFHLADSRSNLVAHFGTKDLSAFGVDEKDEAVRAAGACLRYARETQKAAIEHISDLKYFETNDCLVLDAVTLRNLEIFDSRTGDKRLTLFGVIDETVTGMGSRLLRVWFARPSIKRSEIQTRLAAISELIEPMLRQKVRFLLKEVADLERLTGKINLATATARDLLALNRSLKQTPEINAGLADAASLLLQVLTENIFELPEIREYIDRAIADEPPVSLADGGTIRDGFNAELDELRSISRSGKQTIASFEEREKERTGIGNLKVRFNNVFGYYIEITKGNLANAPDDYERKQTLANAERFTTPELKEWESKVLGAEEQIIKIEAEQFNLIRLRIREETKRLQATARALATLDTLCALAEVASKRDLVCPVLHDSDEIEIKNGRHPVVEASLNSEFIPNDMYLNNSTDRLLIITGANMGGKSTVLRQIALIQILAQVGSFVPATSAKLPILDRIWTRVGASDDLASGRSTFMVEMTETAAILHNATPRSLILLDEIGRGTSTFDGLSIAWAVAEYIHNSPEHSAKTLFATHYHELTELAENLSGAKNYQLTATEKDGDVVFLHKLQKGKASKSYGIAVGKLAGLPPKIIERAKEVLEKLEKYELAVFADEKPAGLGKAAAQRVASQVSLFAIANEGVVDQLRALNVESLSETGAKEILAEMKRRIV
ncbi:MAG: DNA mismatch repair protein MutS [Acidobacteriota bacterium]